METKKELAVTKATKELMATKVTREDIKNLFCPLATDKELALALGIVKSLNLNPFIREVHFVKYREADKISIIVGYEVYIKRAERTGKLNGWASGIDEEKKTAWVKIFRKDWTEPFYWEVSLEEFNKKQATWNQMPSFMGKKVAIAQGFRLAFPDELGGMPYTKEEAEVYDVEGEVSPAIKPDVEMPKAKVQQEPVYILELKKARALIGLEAFNKILGNAGYETIESVENEKQAKAILAEAKTVYDLRKEKVE